MITNNWRIYTCEHDTATGGIVVAHWRLDAEQTVDNRVYRSSVHGSVSMTPDSNDPAFVPYESLTEEVVLSWVWNEVDKVAAEAQVANDLNAKINPVIGRGLPWQIAGEDVDRRRQ